jgi:hypothetical protein
VKYLPLFHHFKAIYQFPKHIIFWVKIVANASLISFLHVNMGQDAGNQVFFKHGLNIKKT